MLTYLSPWIGEAPSSTPGCVHRTRADATSVTTAIPSWFPHRLRVETGTLVLRLCCPLNTPLPGDGSRRPPLPVSVADWRSLRRFLTWPQKYDAGQGADVEPIGTMIRKSVGCNGVTSLYSICICTFSFKYLNNNYCTGNDVNRWPVQL